MNVGPEKSYTVSKIFIDTNIFVDSIDKKEELKRKKARTILKKIVESHQPVISTQVIKEFNTVNLSFPRTSIQDIHIEA